MSDASNANRSVASNIPEQVGPPDSPNRDNGLPDQAPDAEEAHQGAPPARNPGNENPQDELEDLPEGEAVPQDQPPAPSYFQMLKNMLTPIRPQPPPCVRSTGRPTTLRYHPGSVNGRTVPSGHVPPPPPPTNGPIMGGWKCLGQYYEPWTGGKPNRYWTGLEDPVTSTNNPNFLRGSGPKSTFQYNQRREGLYKDDPTRRFSESGDLDDFCKQLKHAFNNNGLNTIAYRNDPANHEEMLYVLEEYPRLHSKTIKHQTIFCKPMWDSYDEANDESARKFLFESIQDNL